jgi:hypothetical protein
MRIKCESCGKHFEPSDKDRKDIERAKKKGKTFLFITCGVCHLGTIYNPSGTEVKHKSAIRLLRCPVRGCTGFVVELNENRVAVWSCGECGSAWKRIESVYREIDKIVKKFPYRRKCYRKRKDAWMPAPARNEPSNYDERVEQEEQRP